MSYEVIQINTRGEKFYSITSLVQESLKKILKQKEQTAGILHLFVMHTSCALLISEDYDPSARKDLESFLKYVAPRDLAFIEHTLEGPDEIDSAYKDELVDVDPGLKPWYLRYYMPTLQKRESSWNDLIPTLKIESEKRVADNTDYQKFINGEGGWFKFGEGLSNKNDDLPDYQMDETVNILKDMINLERKYHNSGVADY